MKLVEGQRFLENSAGVGLTVTPDGSGISELFRVSSRESLGTPSTLPGPGNLVMLGTRNDRPTNHHQEYRRLQPVARVVWRSIGGCEDTTDLVEKRLMTKPFYVAFYFVEFVAGVNSFSMAERGIYISLLCHQFQNGYIPSSRKRLLIICPGADGDDLDMVLSKFKPCQGDKTRLVNTRATHELETARLSYDRKQRQTEAARRAPRRGDSSTGPVTDPVTGSVTDHRTRIRDRTKSNTKSKRTTKAALPPIPDELDTPMFIAKWEEWLEFRRVARRNPVSPLAAKKQFNNLVKVGTHRAMETIDLAIANDYTGLFPKKLKDLKLNEEPEMEVGYDGVARPVVKR